MPPSPFFSPFGRRPVLTPVPPAAPSPPSPRLVPPILGPEAGLAEAVPVQWEREGEPYVGADDMEAPPDFGDRFGPPDDYSSRTGDLDGRADREEEEAVATIAAALPDVPLLPTIGRTPLEVLADIWGYHGFRPGQEEIVQTAVDGHDVMLLMPTGGGKSVCFQLPALIRPGMAVVVSPLIALMQDQVARLRQCGVYAAALNNEVSDDEQRATVRDVRAGKVKLLYVAPERLVMSSFVDLLKSTPLALFAIDEAHCVSHWGHNFRPEYAQIGSICAHFPGVPRIAVTATASPETQEDMKANLRMDDAKVFKTGFDRPNISYTIVNGSDSNLSADKQFLEFMEGHRSECGVVYCTSIKDCEKYAALLCSKGFDALPYYASLNKVHGGRDVKKETLERFLKEDGVVVCATIAFGMGIDKPDVRFVAHTGLPTSLENYYQETGRAGRDGLESEAWMIYSSSDYAFKRSIIDNEAQGKDPAYRSMAFRRLDALSAMVEGGGCRRAAVLRYFGEQPPERCGKCDRCISPVTTFDASKQAQMVLSAARRTGERYGRGHLIEVLTGARSEKVTSKGHDRLPTHGVGSAYSTQWWNSVVQQMANSGYFESPPHLHGGLRITDLGRRALSGEAEVRLIEPVLRKGKAAARPSPKRQFNLADDVPSERLDLFEELRSLRLRLAKAMNLPPYAIFYNDTLVGIVETMPDTLQQLGRIDGIGATKLARYGAEVLRLVGKYRKPNPVPAQIEVPGFGRR